MFRLLLVVLCLVIAHPVHGAIFTAPLPSNNAPAAYGAHGNSNPVEGLFQACLNSQDIPPEATDRAALTIRTPAMSVLVMDTLGQGGYYIAGFYDKATNGWFWADGASGARTLFGHGPHCEPVGELLALDWAQGFPQTEKGTNAIGDRIFMVYDGSAKGWINVDGKQAYDGVLCEGKDLYVKKSLPWWGILLIVLACIAAVVLIGIIALRCRRKKRPEPTDDDYSDEEDNESKSFQARPTGAATMRQRNNVAPRAGSQRGSHSAARSSASGSHSYSDEESPLSEENM
ncbi:hypothetical protein ABL78_6769 [Leptomonas seymouri]|uniref:Uncharacterized protein n=1 Tax=Leptomonas seymouri TaxID=5684 RepID=A0A0N1PAN6_LEPSE|nr:hypothetical protein ABL78_6769 [Leptomonas seymouri]|eukprot:KPI84180.1 hypothetical protein ABL78_6769 [Leptomonas seymouri]